MIQAIQVVRVVQAVIWFKSSNNRGKLICHACDTHTYKWTNMHEKTCIFVQLKAPKNQIASEKAVFGLEKKTFSVESDILSLK